MVCFGALSSPTQEWGLSVRAIEQLLPSQEAMNRLKDLVVYVAKTRDLANYVLDNELARIDVDRQEGRWEEDVQLMVYAYMLGLAMRRWHDVTRNRREGLTRQLRVAYVDEVYGQ